MQVGLYMPMMHQWFEEETRKAILTDNPQFSNYVEHRINYSDGGLGYIGVKYFIKKDKNGKNNKNIWS